MSYPLVQTHRTHNTKSKPQKNYGLWVIELCQHRFIRCNKCTTLVRDAGNAEAMQGLVQGVYGKISAPSSQFCYKPKTAVKNSLLFLNWAIW